MNISDTANTTMSLAAQGATDVQNYHKFTYTVQNNQAGTATLNFKNQIAGMKIIDAKGNALANNTVTIGQAFSLLISDSTPTGDLTFDINGSIKAIVPVAYNDGVQKYQDSISLVTGVVKPLLAGNKAKWTRAAGLIKVHKGDQDGKALAGAEFTLTDNLGGKLTAVTDKNGIAQFQILVNRTYTLKETKTPAGYQGSFKQTGITLTKDGQTFEYTAKNTLEKGIVKIHKVDQNGKALAGVEFTLTDNLGNKQTLLRIKMAMHNLPLSLTGCTHLKKPRRWPSMLVASRRMASRRYRP